MSKITKFWLAIVGLVILMQLFRPDKNSPSENVGHTLSAKTQMPSDVQRILDRSCADCHSYRTRWPWYSNIAPISWVVIDDVNEGRRNMNFSEWADYDAAGAADRLKSICDDAKSGDMPLASYRWVHREAKLSDAEKKVVCDWTNTERNKLFRGTNR